jgi:hypothetical protein
MLAGDLDRLGLLGPVLLAICHLADDYLQRQCVASCEAGFALVFSTNICKSVNRSKKEDVNVLSSEKRAYRSWSRRCQRDAISNQTQEHPTRVIREYINRTLISLGRLAAEPSPMCTRRCREIFVEVEILSRLLARLDSMIDGYVALF